MQRTLSKNCIQNKIEANVESKGDKEMMVQIINHKIIEGASKKGIKSR